MTNNRPITISVIIPTHDRDDMLEKAVVSAAEQRHQPVEIIVVDDMARAETEELCDRLATRFHDSVRYLVNSGGDVANGSRNIAAKQARGSYLAFLDDDDSWDLGYLEHVVDSALKNDVKVVVTGVMNVDPSGNRTPGKKPPDVFDINDYFLKNPGVLGSNIIVEHQAFDEIGGYDPSVKGSSDKDILIRLIEKGNSYQIVSERLVLYLTHAEQWSFDDARVLPNIVGFYLKYWSRMGFLTHLKMIKKIARLTQSTLRTKLSLR